MDTPDILESSLSVSGIFFLLSLSFSLCPLWNRQGAGVRNYHVVVLIWLQLGESVSDEARNIV